MLGPALLGTLLADVAAAGQSQQQPGLCSFHQGPPRVFLKTDGITLQPAQTWADRGRILMLAAEQISGGRVANPPGRLSDFFDWGMLANFSGCVIEICFPMSCRPLGVAFE